MRVLDKIVCIVGMPGSGKSTVVDIFSKILRVKPVHTGDVIREEIKKRGLKYTPENDKKIAEWFHRCGRERLLVKRALKKVKGEIALLEGFRSPESIRILKEVTGIKPIIIAVEAPFEVRLKRELKRKRFGEEETISYIKERDKVEIKRGIKKLMKMADFRIDNSDGISKTKRQITKILKKINS